MPAPHRATPVTQATPRAAAWIVASAMLLGPAAAWAQNVAIVNGKPVPKARVDALLTQATAQGQPRTPELETQVRDEVVLREMFMQEAEKRGMAASPEYKAQMEFARRAVGYQMDFNVSPQLAYNTWFAQSPGAAKK